MNIKLKAKRLDAGDKVVRLVVMGRGSFVNLIEATEFGGKWTYNSNILLPRDQYAKGAKAVIDQAIEDAKELGKAKWGGRIPKSLDLPLRDGDDKYDDNPDIYDAYQGCDYLVAKKVKSQGRPNLMDKYGEPVTEEGILESGYWFAFDINFYAYKNESKGIAVGLNAVRLLKEDESFGGGPSRDSSNDAFNDAFGDDFDADEEDDDDIPL